MRARRSSTTSNSGILFRFRIFFSDRMKGGKGLRRISVSLRNLFRGKRLASGVLNSRSVTKLQPLVRFGTLLTRLKPIYPVPNVLFSVFPACSDPWPYLRFAEPLPDSLDADLHVCNDELKGESYRFDVFGSFSTGLLGVRQ